MRTIDPNNSATLNLGVILCTAMRALFPTNLTPKRDPNTNNTLQAVLPQPDSRLAAHRHRRKGKSPSTVSGGTLRAVMLGKPWVYRAASEWTAMRAKAG